MSQKDLINQLQTIWNILEDGVAQSFILRDQIRMLTTTSLPTQEQLNAIALTIVNVQRDIFEPAYLIGVLLQTLPQV